MEIKGKTLYEYLDTDLKTTQEFIRRRTKNSQKIFYIAYGENLDQVLNIDMIGNISNFETTLNAVKKAFDEKKFTLSAICGCSQDTITTYLPGFSFSPRNFELLQKVFGPNYDRPYDMSTLTLSEIPAYNQLLSLVKEKLEGVKRKNSYDLSMEGKSVLSFLKCSKEELEVFKVRVIENRRKIRFAFYAVFGPHLDKPANILNLREDQIADFEEGIKEGQTVIATYREDHMSEKAEKEKRRRALMQKIRASRDASPETVKTSPKPENEEKIFLYDILECKKEELALFISKLGFVQEPYWALRKAFGEDFLSPLNLTCLTKRELKKYDKGIKELKNFKKQYLKEEKKKLPFIVKGTREEIMAIIEGINPDTSRYKILVKVFGSNFDQAKDLSNITPEEKILYNDATAFIRKKLRKAKEPTQTLAEIVGCSYEKLLELLSDKDKNSAQYQALVKAHGMSFDQVKNVDALKGKERDAYNQAVCSLRKKFKNPKTEKSKAYLYRILRCKWERLENILNQMDKNSPYYLVLAKAFNNDFAGPKVGILTSEEEIVYEEAKTYLKSMLYSAKKRMNDKYLWELVGCSKEQLLTLIKSLPDDWTYFSTLQEMFGSNLDERKQSNVSLKSVTYPLRLLRLRYQRIFVEGKEINEVKQRKYVAKTLYDVIGCKYNELQELTCYLLDEHLELLRKIYGQNLDKEDDLTNITIEEKHRKKYIIRRLKELYKRKFVLQQENISKGKQRRNKNKTLMDALGCTIDEIQSLIGYLNPNYLSILKRVYGENLDQKQMLNNLENGDDLRIYRYAIRRLKHVYKDMYIDKNENKLKVSKQQNLEYLYEIIGCSKDDIPVVMSCLRENSLSYQVLVKVFGKDFLGKRDLSTLTNQEKDMYGSVKARLKKYYEQGMPELRNNRKYYIWEAIGCSKEELLTLYPYLNSRYQEVLQLVHGSSLDKSSNSSVLSKEEKSTYFTARNRLKKLYQYIYIDKDMSKVNKTCSKENTTLDEIIGCSKEEVAKIVGLLDKDSTSFEVIVKVHGASLDKPRNFSILTSSEKSTCRSAYKRLRRFYEQGGKNVRRENKVKTLEDAYLNVEAIPVLIPYLEERYQQIMYIYLATKDIDMISKLMNMKIEDVKKCLNLIYHWFNQVSEMYTVHFNDELPTLEVTENKLLRKLEK